MTENEKQQANEMMYNIFTKPVEPTEKESKFKLKPDKKTLSEADEKTAQLIGNSMKEYFKRGG